MSERYSILFKKDKEGSTVKDTVEEWNIAATDVPFSIMEDTQDLPEREWAGVDGVDCYVPEKIPLKAFDMEVELCYKGGMDTAYDNLKSFADYLRGADGSGAVFSVYSPHTGIGKSGCRLKSFAPDDFWNSKDGTGLVFSITIRVMSPESSITLEAS